MIARPIPDEQPVTSTAFEGSDMRAAYALAAQGVSARVAPPQASVL